MQVYVNPYHTLYTKSTTVDLTQSIAGYSDLEKFERSMVNLMIASRGIGLAANQIGITKRFFVIGYESFDVFTKPVILWNPSIVRSSEEIVEDVEGCLSFPGIWVKVKRPKQVTVRWQNLKGETLMQHLDGIESKCFQHELDHIDGITFNTRVSKLKWDMAKKKAYR
jgi:peptide deformylase